MSVSSTCASLLSGELVEKAQQKVEGADQCPARSQAVIATPRPTTPVYILRVASYGMEYSLGRFGSAVLATLPHGFLCAFSLQSLGS